LVSFLFFGSTCAFSGFYLANLALFSLCCFAYILAFI